MQNEESKKYVMIIVLSFFETKRFIGVKMVNLKTNLTPIEFRQVFRFGYFLESYRKKKN